MNIKIDYVRGEDWEGMYINGKLVLEGHSLITSDVLKCLKSFYDEQNINTISNIDVYSHYVNQEWLENEGNMPNMFADIPKDVFE